MDEEPEDDRPKPKTGVVAVVIVAGTLLVLSLFRATLSYLIIVLPPLVVGSLVWFLYHVFLRKYLRARRIAQARERRLWKDAARR
jgi:hypothetical protein